MKSGPPSKRTGRLAAHAIAWGVAATIHGSARSARADPDKPEVHFSADEVDGDAKMRELSLRGNVVVNYERFRLTSPALSLQRTPRGIDVQGPGEVVFCPCPDPPVAVGFEGGLVAPPADLILRRPRLLVGGVTVFALPWFWLRAPSRIGILPPNLAWRGGDGLLMGDGVHIPWRDGDELGELDLTAAGYLKGGVELAARLRTLRATTRLRWDHLNGDLLALDSHGAYPQGEIRTVAWDVDALRGSRARSGTLNLDEAAQGYDRGAAEVTLRWADGALFGVGVRAVGARGGFGPSKRPAWGPRISLGLGGAVFSRGAWDALSTFSVLEDPSLGPTNLARLEGGLEMNAAPGFLVTRLTLREAMTAGATETMSAFDGISSARLEVAAPLVRVYPDDGAPLVHVIEPRVAGAIVAARTSGAYWSQTGREFAQGSGQLAMTSLGLRSAWGRLLGHAGASLEGDVGSVATLSEAGLSHAEAVSRYRAGWNSRYLGLGAEGGALLRTTAAQVLVGKVRVGAQDDWHVTVKAAGRRGIEPILARALAAPTGTEPSGGWLAAEGWSGGGEIEGRLTRSLGARVSAEEDFTASRLLQIRGSVGYAHPCRCISVDAFAARRLGREGVDIWVSIDLAPR